MRRIVSLFLPHLPVERLAKLEPAAMAADRPLALVASASRGQTIRAVNEAARRHGILPGMALADARAMLPALGSRQAEPRRDRALLDRLARWAGRYGPARNNDGEDGLWIDIAGVAHLFAGKDSPPAPDGGETALLADLVRRLAAAGLTARAGLADTLSAAHALARHATGGTCPYAVARPGETRAMLAGLPVEALRLTNEAVLLLRRLGFRCIGDLYGLPRAALERRLRDRTTAAGVLLRLDQALGLAGEPRQALAEPPLHAIGRHYGEPLIIAAAIEAEVRSLAVELAGRLAAAGLGARRLVLSLYRSDASLATIEVGTSRACRDPDHLFALIAVRLGDIDAGFGIDALGLEAGLVEPLTARQGVLGAPARDVGAARLVDRLANRLGARSVLRLETRSSHRPERAAAPVPAMLAGPARRRPDAESPRPAIGPRPQAPRPALLFSPPERIDVMAEVPEGAPVRFTWRRRTHRISKAEGPERIEPEWWLSLAPAAAPSALEGVRDYYRLEDVAGGSYWVFRAGRYAAPEKEEESGEERRDEAEGGRQGRASRAQPPHWYIHGLFP